MKSPVALVLALSLAGCAARQERMSAPVPPEIAAGAPTPRPLPRPEAADSAIPIAGAQPAAALDTTTAGERAAAMAAPTSAGAVLGQVSVALGSPAEQGFWLRAPLVAHPGKGRVELPGGASVAVELRPGAGGALLSLAAYRALGLALTDLPVVVVYAR